jgi:hypothetical protein
VWCGGLPNPRAHAREQMTAHKCPANKHALVGDEWWVAHARTQARTDEGHGVDTCRLSPCCPVGVVFIVGLSTSCHCGWRAQVVVRTRPNAQALRQGGKENNHGRAGGSPISKGMCR